MDDLEKLKAKYISGNATEHETSQLLELCKNNKNVLLDLAEHTKTNRLLSSLPTDLSMNDKEILEQLKNSSPDISLKVVNKISQQRKIKSTVIGFSIAAAALLTITALFSTVKIATVTNNLEAKWTQELDSNLNAGNYHIKSGFSKLKFSSGAKILIEGPADFQLIDDMHIVLSNGKIVADIPQSALGFRVDTLNSNTIDLGTKFAIATSNSGATEIHVISGSVKSKAKQNKEYIELKEEEALRINKDNSSQKLKADTGKFLTLLPPKKLSKLKHILWRFDEGEGSVAKNESSGYEQEYKANLKPDKGKKPKWIDGKFGKALSFDGKTNFVKTDFPGIGGSNSRTVCFWVKAGKEKNGYAIITWGSFEKYGATWQISLNPNKADGPLGRIRCGTHSGQVIGTQDLRDNNWHHVAVVMYGGPEANVSTHMLIFVDGKLENAYRKSIRQIDTDIESSKAIRVQMGKNAAANNNPQTIHKFFKGALDEVYVFNYALTPNEIRSIIKNQPIFK